MRLRSLFWADLDTKSAALNIITLRLKSKRMKIKIVCLKVSKATAKKTFLSKINPQEEQQQVTKNNIFAELQLSTTTQKAVQVVQAKNKYSQTDHEIATQTSSVCSPAAAQRGKIKINHNRDGILIRNSERSENDDFPPLGGGRDKEGKVLIGLSSRYQTADDWNAIRNKHVSRRFMIQWTPLNIPTLGQSFLGLISGWAF